MAVSLSQIFYALFFSLPAVNNIILLPLLLVGLWFGDLFRWHSGRVTFSGLSPLCFSQTSSICIDVYLLPPLTQYKGHLIIQSVWFLYKTSSSLHCWWERRSSDIWSVIENVYTGPNIYIYSTTLVTVATPFKITVLALNRGSSQTVADLPLSFLLFKQWIFDFRQSQRQFFSWGRYRMVGLSDLAWAPAFTDDVTLLTH